jgi:hypothetical protein
MLDGQTIDVKINLQEAIRAISEFDSKKPKAQIDLYISRGFDMKIEDIKPKQSIDKAVFVKVVIDDIRI